jgi:hypothetical protein
VFAEVAGLVRVRWWISTYQEEKIKINKAMQALSWRSTKLELNYLTIHSI